MSFWSLASASLSVSLSRNSGVWTSVLYSAVSMLLKLLMISSSSCCCSWSTVPGMSILVCRDGCSVMVRHWHLDSSTGIGDTTGEEATCLLPAVCTTAVVISFNSHADKGRGWVHWTDVPCQLLVPSVLETKTWNFKMSILSIDTYAKNPVAYVWLDAFVNLLLQTTVASLRFVSSDVTAPTRLSTLTRSCDSPWHRIASINRLWKGMEHWLLLQNKTVHNKYAYRILLIIETSESVLNNLRLLLLTDCVSCCMKLINCGSTASYSHSIANEAYFSGALEKFATKMCLLTGEPYS